MDISIYQKSFLSYLEEQQIIKHPKNLYEPIGYILKLGGKKIRPILTLIAADVFSNSFTYALPAAMAVEVFHNFTLVHDDIMDDAVIRRGQKTVHEKWDINTGILSGDGMLILAYKYFENYDANIFKKLIKLFTKTALEVCEGQQLDIDFETRNNVTIEEYIEMIRLKTSVLIASALKMGAIIASATEKEADLIYEYGVNLGIAFQLQDDYLDTFGNSATFGKQIGGDIIENKKTFLYLKSLEISNKVDKNVLLDFYKNKEFNNELKIKEVTKIFKKNGIQELSKNQIDFYTYKAFASLENLEISMKHKEILKSFGTSLMSRSI